MAVLRYGSNSSLEFEGGDGAKCREVGLPRDEPQADLDAALFAALRDPMDYPPFVQSTTPTDHVVLALDQNAPRIAQITSGMIRDLIEAGVAPEGISVLRGSAEGRRGAEDPCCLLDPALRARITLVTHDPTDRRQLAYLAASDAGDAILVNRVLHEADVVLSIGCLRAAETAGYFGIHGTVFPAFSDTKTIQRFRGFGSLDRGGARRGRRMAEVEHVAWLLGVHSTIQLVPGPGDQVLHVLAGESHAVERQGRSLYQAAWGWPAAPRASLVVAGIPGGAAHQTWENLGQAVQAASRFVEEDGAIAVCCELAGALGPAFRRLAQGESRDAALRAVGRERPVDALPAAQLARALQKYNVYLLSQLDPSVVEELDLVPLEKPAELIRLARQHESCVLISNACYVTVDKEGASHG